MIYLKIPRINRKTKKQDGFRWSLRVYNEENKRYEPVPVHQIPVHIRNAQEENVVEEYCKSKSAEMDAIKYRIQKRLEWQEKYHNFEDLLKDYERYQKEKAPNSYQTDVHYLSHYAFPFFLTHKEANNIENWPLYFEKYKAWLKEVRPLKEALKSLSLNTQNRCIKSLNQLMGFYGSENGKVMPKCPHYPRKLLTEVTAEDILSESEIKAVHEQLKEIREVSADLFMVLARTGMRLNEGLGLSMKFINPGKIQGVTSDKIHEQLLKYELGIYHGYICLESQPRFEPFRVTKNYQDPQTKKIYRKNSVPRKPLKSRSRIDPKWFRFIPVFDKEAWKILGKRYNEQVDLFAKATFGEDMNDYLLFDGITANMFYQDMVKAFEAAKLRFRSPHKLRHTFLTWFYSKINSDRFLSKKVGGHEDERSMEIYNHLAEQIGREQSMKAQKLKKIAI